MTRTLARATTAPMRIGLSAGELALEAALGVVRGTRRAIERDGRRAPAPRRPPRPPEPRPRPPVRAAPERGAPQPPPRPEAARPPVSPAEVTVGAPWEGYDELTAADIQRRLADADRETVAAVALYEGSHRDRRSVIRATERRLRALAL